ncbi:unnamed protein product [Dibothriocephalus latus]|uniref:Uncharacterized protein n=1 Tax=Dibothriocephalus latus TaxID=60516 RepID=A0A3P7R470_DIBLA|nr:unnamed protein product [Dibothriocephalus latus]
MLQKVACSSYIRSTLKSDLGCSVAELVFGAPVRLPGELISPSPPGTVEEPANLLHRLRQFLRTLSPVPPRLSVSESYLKKDLATCSHVFLRCERVRRPFKPPYEGPFRVISRGTIIYRIQRGTREEVVSVYRLKAAVPDTSLGEPSDINPAFGVNNRRLRSCREALWESAAESIHAAFLYHASYLLACDQLPVVNRCERPRSPSGPMFSRLLATQAHTHCRRPEVRDTQYPRELFMRNGYPKGIYKPPPTRSAPEDPNGRTTDDMVRPAMCQRHLRSD